MRVAVVVPIYRKYLMQDEHTSLHHLQQHLGGLPLFTIQPAGLGLGLTGFDVREFSAHFFTSVDAYSKLLLSPAFYKTFTEFHYILIYQTDCLVFSPDLSPFCDPAYDYLGAPLFEKNSQPPRLSRIGNGGLSLRRVQACLDVLQTRHIPSWTEIFRTRLPDLKRLSPASRWLKTIKTIRDARRGAQWYAQNYSLNEDLFWSDRARLFQPSFSVAPIETGLRFAFDAHPRICFQENGGHLPFGAHAWQKWDRTFWEPHLLT